MNAIQELEKLGYVVSLAETGIKYTFQGQGTAPDVMDELIARIRLHKAEAIEFLQKRNPAIPLDELHDYLTDHRLRLAGIASCMGGCVTFTVVDA